MSDDEFVMGDSCARGIVSVYCWLSVIQNYELKNCIVRISRGGPDRHRL